MHRGTLKTFFLFSMLLACAKGAHANETIIPQCEDELKRGSYAAKIDFYIVSENPDEDLANLYAYLVKCGGLSFDVLDSGLTDTSSLFDYAKNNGFYPAGAYRLGRPLTFANTIFELTLSRSSKSLLYPKVRAERFATPTPPSAIQARGRRSWGNKAEVDIWLQDEAAGKKFALNATKFLQQQYEGRWTGAKPAPPVGYGRLVPQYRASELTLNQAEKKVAVPTDLGLLDPLEVNEEDDSETSSPVFVVERHLPQLNDVRPVGGLLSLVDLDRYFETHTDLAPTEESFIAEEPSSQDDEGHSLHVGYLIGGKFQPRKWQILARSPILSLVQDSALDRYVADTCGNGSVGACPRMATVNFSMSVYDKPCGKSVVVPDQDSARAPAKLLAKVMTSWSDRLNDNTKPFSVVAVPQGDAGCSTEIQDWNGATALLDILAARNDAVAVVATKRKGGVLLATPYGDNSLLSIAVNGEEIPSLDIHDDSIGFRMRNGSSQATAIVSRIVAAKRSFTPSLSVYNIKAMLLGTAQRYKKTCAAAEAHECLSVLTGRINSKGPTIVGQLDVARFYQASPQEGTIWFRIDDSDCYVDGKPRPPESGRIGIFRVKNGAAAAQLREDQSVPPKWILAMYRRPDARFDLLVQDDNGGIKLRSNISIEPPSQFGTCDATGNHEMGRFNCIDIKQARVWSGVNLSCIEQIFVRSQAEQ